MSAMSANPLSTLILSAFFLISFVPDMFATEAPPAPLFPFAISEDAPDNAVNASRWIEAPAGKDGLIRVRDGRFFNDKGRVLFWGTNLCFDACFPSREDAERTAARIARLGFNAVRLHHMDARDIWGDSWSKKSKNLTTIDPDQLDKLDYLIYQLKKHGVYVNINLHVSRWFDDRDGFSGKDLRPKYDKGLDNFYPPFIELQKKYARDLLTHVNPYTKTAYIDEPAVCMVEINNENSIVRQWASGRLPETMPDPYAAEYRRQWNRFLVKKYGTTEAVKKAWECREVPLGDEIFTHEQRGYWRLNTGGSSKASLIRKDQLLQIDVEKQGNVSWMPQLTRGKLEIEKDMIYTLSFRMKSDQDRTISTGVAMNHEPWTNLGFSKRIDIRKDWQTFSFEFLANQSDQQARVDFSNFSPGTYEITDVSFKRGGILGLRPGQTLETETVPTIPKNANSFSGKAMDDFCEFLIETERNYWIGMYRFLKDDLKVRQPISGTQVNYGSTVVQAELDYCDVHAYWNHPTFPGKPWDSKNWFLHNRALVNSPDRSIFAHLATRRVYGKPYTVSEYDHPFPNQYAAEGLPMIAAFGRLQGWDGVFQFTYGSSKANSNDRLTSYFNINANTVKLAHNPACFAIFCRGDVAEGKTVRVGDWSAERELSIFQKDRSTGNFNFKGIGLDMRLALLGPTALKIGGDSEDRSNTYPVIEENATRFQSETQELAWDFSREKKGFFRLDTTDTKLFTGFVDEGDEHRFDGVGVRFGKNRLGWCTLSMVSVDGNGFGKNSQGRETRILVAATGLMEHTGMQLQYLDDDKITLSNQWGKAPILCEGIPAAIVLDGVDSRKVRFFPLDEHGNRREAVDVQASPEGCVVELSPSHKTVWYEILVSP